MASDELRSRYDLIPYFSVAIPHSHPDNLRTIAALAGLSTAPVTRCRVLELGCAAAGNLAPMAQTFPGSSFLGIDFSSEEISAGLNLIQSANLKNIELRCQDLLDFNDSAKFDYIIAHGVYSWVPQEVREKLMQICATNLAPNGIAYLNYNTLPGWHIKHIARDMMIYHARKASEDKERAPLGRGMLGLAKETKVASPAYQTAVIEAHDRLARESDWSVVHDDMEIFNKPVYLEQFTDHASAHGLRYLGVANQLIEELHLLPEDVKKQILQVSKNQIEREQYTDFVTGRTYRDAVLCWPDVPISAPAEMGALTEMHVASNLREEDVRSNSGIKESIRFDHPSAQRSLTSKNPGVIAVLRFAKEHWPNTVPFHELVQRAIAADPSSNANAVTTYIAEHVLYFYKTAMVELWTRPLEFIEAAPAQPRLTPLARVQSTSNLPLANLRHAWLAPDAQMLKLMPFLDGTRNREQLFQYLWGLLQKEQFEAQNRAGKVATIDQLREWIDATLDRIANASFLWKQMD